MTAIRKDLLLHQKCQKDFKNHLYTVFKYLNLPHPTQIQYDIADVLQYRDVTGVLPDTILEGFRGVAKSTITGAYASWRFDNDPENYQLLQISMNQTEANKFLKFTRKLLDIVPYLNYLIPDEKKGNRDSAIQFDVAPAVARVQPSCKSIGIFGAITGNRATEIICDDIETSQNCDTATKREQIRAAITEFSPVLRPLKGRVLYLGTPHTEESVYNEEAKKGFTRVQIFPVRYPNSQEILKYQGNLADALVKRLEANPSLVGQPTDPLRFDEETILKEEAKGRSKFLMQYMLDNSLSDLERYPLKCNDLIVMDTDNELAPEKVAYGSSPNLILKDLTCLGLGQDRFYTNLPINDDDIKWLPYTFKLMAIDPSGKGRDELAYSIIGVLNGQLFLLRNDGLQGGYCDENLKKLAEEAKEFKVNKILVENNFGQGMFSALLTPVLNTTYPCEIEEVRQNTQKEKRIIDTLEPVMNRHKLIVSKDVIKKDLESIKKYPIEEQREYSLIYQMTRLTKDRGCLSHDDRLDVLAIAVGGCLELLKIDTETELMLRQEEEMDRYFNEAFAFIDEQMPNQNWFN